MAKSSSKKTGWGFKVIAVVSTVAAIALIFGLSFSASGNEIRSIVRAMIPVGSGVLAAGLLGKIGRLDGSRWQIYVTVLLLAVVMVWLKIAGIF